jgi:hypothetical protein
LAKIAVDLERAPNLGEETGGGKPGDISNEVGRAKRDSERFLSSR